MSETYLCEFCNKQYTSISNLKHHQKTAKFCLDIQSTLSKTYKCEFCSKTFDTNKYLKQHLQNYCKIHKIYIENENLKNENIELKNKLNQQDKLLKNELKYKLDQKDKELKFKLDQKENDAKTKLQFKDDIIKLKDETINKLEKEIHEYKKIANRPTTVYNTKNTTNTNNYQIQYNQLLEKIETLNSENISKKINLIDVNEVYTLDIPKFEKEFSSKLSNIFKDFTFCIDKNKQVVVTKNNSEEKKEMNIKEFINSCLTLGKKDLHDILFKINQYHETFIDELDKDTYTPFDDYVSDATIYFKDDDNKKVISIDDKKNPFKQILNNTLLSCEHLTKKC
jgi:hypothetical protein